MLPTAHIASALLANRLAGLGDDAAPAVLGALVPDLIDKTLSWVLGVVPASRHIGHTPLAVAVASIGVAAFVGRRRAAAFGLAYLVHLLGDLWEHGHVPWLMPFKRYDQAGERWQVQVSAGSAALEVLGFAYLLWAAKEGSASSRRAALP